jgi:hypothetical protein
MMPRLWTGPNAATTTMLRYADGRAARGTWQLAYHSLGCKDAKAFGFQIKAPFQKKIKIKK